MKVGDRVEITFRRREGDYTISARVHWTDARKKDRKGRTGVYFGYSDVKAVSPGAPTCAWGCAWLLDTPSPFGVQSLKVIGKAKENTFQASGSLFRNPGYDLLHDPRGLTWKHC